MIFLIFDLVESFGHLCLQLPWLFLTSIVSTETHHSPRHLLCRPRSRLRSHRHLHYHHRQRHPLRHTHLLLLLRHTHHIHPRLLLLLGTHNRPLQRPVLIGLLRVKLERTSTDPENWNFLRSFFGPLRSPRRPVFDICPEGIFIATWNQWKLVKWL